MTRNGSLGDSTGLLRAALPCRERRVWLTVLDAAAGGGRLALAIGTGEPGAYNACVQVEAEVTGLPEGSFTYTHPYAAGIAGNLGEAAVLAIGALCVVVHEHQVIVIDPQPYVAVGLDPAQAKVLQAKSHVSYRAGFAALTPRSSVQVAGSGTDSRADSG